MQIPSRAQCSRLALVSLTLNQKGQMLTLRNINFSFFVRFIQILVGCFIGSMVSLSNIRMIGCDFNISSQNVS
jgi:hypothetical protein